MQAKLNSDILNIMQEQYNDERNLRKMILRDTINLDRKFTYEEMLNMSQHERILLNEIIGEININSK